MLHLNLAWIAIKYVELIEPRIWKESHDSQTKWNNTDLQPKKKSIVGESIFGPGLTACPNPEKQKCVKL
jgi:hypothetical protein